MDRQQQRPRRRKALMIAGVAAMLIGGVAYQLADRYLIEHVEVAASPAPAAVTTAGNSAASAAASTITPSSVKSDDWTYSSDQLTIAINKVVTGTGSNQITYYAADIKTADTALLKSAFAKNEFGRNITQTTSEIASAHQAIFAINGDYYGFRSDGVVIRNGTLYRNAPAREGVALYQDGTMASYDETVNPAQSLMDKGIVHTLSFGPALVQNGKANEGFNNVKIDTNFGNRSIQSANPRTGIGMIGPNHYVFVVVDGRQTGSRGMTLDEFAQLFAGLGAKEAYNLDGGGSSTMYFMGRVVNNPQGKQEERGVSDILYFGEG